MNGLSGIKEVTDMACQWNYITLIIVFQDLTSNL